MPSYDSLKRSNILFDAFNEQSAEQLTFASWDWYKGATPAFSTADVNLPLPTPVIQASGVTSFDKYYDVSKLQVKPGDNLAFSVLVWFENAGGKLQIYWLDSAGATITTGEASPLVAGISSPVVVIAVPSGASSIRIRVQNTVSGAFKIGAYAAAIGDVTPEFTRSFPSKAYQESLGTPDNLVYDPFGEMLAVRPKQGLPAGVVDATSYAGTLIPNSANSPWGKTGIQNTSGVGADRIISLSSMGVKPGDTITVRLAAWFASTGGTFQVFCRNASGVLSSATIAASASGFNDGSTTLTIPASTTYLTLRASGAMVKELVAIGVAFGRSRPEFIYGSLPAEYSGYQRQQINLWPDPWYRRYECGETCIDGWGPAQVAGVSLPAYVADYSGSPFLRKKSLIIPVGGGQTDINISAKRLGLRAGDSLTVALGVVSSQAINVAAYFRTASGTVISDSSSQLFQFPTQQYQTLVRTIAITQTIVDTAGYLQIRLMNGQTVGAAGVYVVARGLFVGNGSPVLSDDTYRQDVDYTTSRAFTLNQDSLRETHKRLMNRRLSQSATLVTAHIGDSWTHLWNRWSGIFAGKMQADYGSAGIGYIGFGYPSEAGFGQYNGNILGQITLTKTGTWTPTYAAAQSADICSVSSSDTTATFRANGIPANASSVRLFAKPQGSVKYSTDGGVNWTTIDLSTFTDLAVVSLTVPSTAFNIWFSPVSGTVELYGLDVQTATDGVRSHKLGATGSSAQQWAAQVTSATWKAAFTALAPNLVTILHGTNDQTSSRDPSAFAADIQTIITAVRTACPLADVLVIMPCENQRNNNVAMAAYASVVRDVCALNRVAYHNLQIDYGDKPSDYASTSPRNWFNADGIHPDPATGGGLPIVSAVLKLM
ncbi:TPA: SGNH/GDSL hydrolase family protein [Klebsiella pneumoniae]